MKYPFDEIEIGKKKTRLFIAKRELMNARKAAYRLQAATRKRFDITIDGLRLTVARLPDGRKPRPPTCTDHKVNYRTDSNEAMFDPLHRLHTNETLRVKFLRRIDLRKYAEAAKNVADAKKWRVAIRGVGLMLEVHRADTPKYSIRKLNGVKVHKTKYPFNMMPVGSSKCLRCSTVIQRERARQAAYTMAALKGWQFRTEVVEGNYNLKVWRIK